MLVGSLFIGAAVRDSFMYNIFIGLLRRFLFNVFCFVEQGICGEFVK